MHTAVINISRFGESPERAIKSALAMKSIINDVVVVSPVVTEKVPLYNNWNKDKKLLKDNNITLRFESILDLNKIQNQLMIYIPSTTQIKDNHGVFKRKIELAERKIPEYKRFAFDATYDFYTSGFSLLYMWICVVYCVDWWRQTLCGFTFHTRHYIRIEEVYTGFKRTLRPLQETPWISCCGFGSHGDRAPIDSSLGIATTGPTGARLSGRKYMLYYFNQREHAFGQGWLLWYWVFSWFYNFAGICWYGPVIAPMIHGILAQQSKIPANLLDYFFEPFSGFRITIFTISFVIHFLILMFHFRWHAGYKRNFLINTIVTALFPLLITVLPLVILWTKLDSSYDTYKYELDPTLEKKIENLD